MPQLTFLPWLKVRQRETFAGVTLLPLAEGLDELRGHDRAFAEAMIAAHVGVSRRADGAAEPAAMTFVRYEKYPLTHELGDDYAVVARTLRVLGAIAQEPASMFLQPSNAFAPVAQLYKDDGFAIAISSGRVLSGGHDIRCVQFTRPTFIPATAEFRISDTRLRAACEQLLKADPQTRAHEALTRALEWFFWANIETDEQNSFVPFVLMLTAFEALLDRDRSSALGFAYAMADALKTPDDVLSTKTINGRDQTLNQQGWWAYEFYRLRSETVHGAEVHWSRQAYGGHAHAELAAIAFRILLRQKLVHLELELPMLSGIGRALLLEKLRSPADGTSGSPH